jgi:hypothetical protein
MTPVVHRFKIRLRRKALCWCQRSPETSSTGGRLVARTKGHRLSGLGKVKGTPDGFERSLIQASGGASTPKSATTRGNREGPGVG